MSDDTLPLVHVLHTSNISWFSLSEIYGLGRGGLKDASHPLQILIINHRLGIQPGLLVITTGVINIFGAVWY